MQATREEALALLEQASSPLVVAKLKELVAEADTALALAAKAKAAAAAAAAAPADAAHSAISADPAAPAPPAKAAAPPQKFTQLSKFSWEQGEYGTSWVTVRAEIPGVGACKAGVDVCFTSESFDLRASVGGKTFRLLREPLAKDIDVQQCKFIVKEHRVVIRLKKVKGEYSYDEWSELLAKTSRADEKKKDPAAGIQDMMKEMYDNGDESTRKAIGEAMLKSRQEQASGGRGELGQGFED